MKLFIQMKFINNLDKLNFSKFWKFFYKSYLMWFIIYFQIKKYFIIQVYK